MRFVIVSRCRVCDWSKVAEHLVESCDACGSGFLKYGRQQILWCRWFSCRGTTAHTVGQDPPKQCPLCERPGRWSVEQPTMHTVIHDLPVGPDPALPYELNHNDRRMLRAAGIAA